MGSRVLADERRCTATSRQTGERCGQPRKGMATVCHYHGGSTPTVARKAREREVEAAARRTLAEIVVRAVVAALDAAQATGEPRSRGRLAAAEVLRSVTIDDSVVGNLP